MSKIEDTLKKFECTEIKITIDRFLGDEKFYFSSLKELVKMPEFAELGKNLLQKDTKASFDTSHAIKGIIANYGIETMYRIIVKIVEPLRAGTPDYDKLIGYYKKLMNELERVKKIAENS